MIHAALRVMNAYSLNIQHKQNNKMLYMFTPNTDAFIFVKCIPCFQFAGLATVVHLLAASAS